jgi:ubiquinone/menaquinone biosynthesis C-methylase UbiE
MIRPQEVYRREFRERVLAFAPRSILEVGCGAGAFLRSLASWNGRLVGIDPDMEQIAALKAEGFDARVGAGEALPFDRGEFDIVASSYTAHHLPDWPAALGEALRVASRAVCVLDVWYDETVPSQRVAADLDRWSKRIDRLGGMIHNDCLGLGTLIAPIANDPGHRVDAVHQLILAPSPYGDLEAFGRERLALAHGQPQLARDFEQLAREAAREGVSDDGALLLTIERI